MSIESLLNEKIELMKQGCMAEATEKYFAENATSDDHNGRKTGSRQEMIDKMNSFVGSISKVNEITLHYSAINGDVSFTEWTFDFDHQGGGKTHWHEIVRSVWKDGKIVNEQYFLC